MADANIAGWSNAVHAMPDGPFVRDIASAVANDGSVDGAARWLLTMAVNALRSRRLPHSPIEAFDFAIHDYEAMDRHWPMMHRMADLLRADGVTIPPDSMATLARFVAERMPAIWAGPSWEVNRLTTRALVLSDRAHDLVGLFASGLKPSGSKDPFALRRAAKHWLMQVMLPITHVEISTGAGS